MRPLYQVFLFSAFEILAIVALVLFFTTVLPMGILVLKRFNFFRKLERFCEQHGLQLQWCRPWYHSLFFNRGQTDFVLKAKGKTYHVAMISTRFRHREHCFLSSRELAVYRRIMLRGVAGGRVRARMHNIDLGTTTKILPIDLTQPVPQGEEKILLFYPVSRDVTCVQSTKKVFLGNGDLVLEGYRFLTRTAFLEEMAGAERYLRKRNPWEMQ